MNILQELFSCFWFRGDSFLYQSELFFWMRKILLAYVMFLFLFSATFVTAATLTGTVYNNNLNIEADVLIEIENPPQKYFAKKGTFEFELPPGTYTLTARKGLIEVTEEVVIANEGKIVFDVFLLPDFTEENELWQDTTQEILEETEEKKPYEWWRYALAGIILIFLGWRFVKLYKKYGSLRQFRKKMNVEHQKTVEEHKQDLAREPGYLEEVISLLQKHEGRIHQKDLRKEMLHLSEAKISLILTELEHKGKIEKIKKGRGNVILMK